jgi:hypothetical protein
MAYEQRELSGSLFKNDKRTNDNQPNARGSAMIDGVEYWVSAWTRRDKNNQPWQSLAFTPKEERSPQPSAKDDRARNAASMRVQAPADFDDEIPF